MFKNTAAKFMVFAWDTTTGVAKTGDAANITCYVSKDYGAVTVLADTSATEMDSTNAKGYYLFDAAQGETNADCLMISAKSSTANIAVIGAPAVIYTRPQTGWLAPTTAGRTLDVSAGGEAGVDWANVGGQSTSVNLSATTTNLVNTATTATTATNLTNLPTIPNNWITAAGINTGAITAAKFAAGAIDAAAIADNAIDAGAIAANAITAAKIADGAIDAATFAADVDAEILSYLVDDATRIDASALNTATGTTIPAIVADTNELQTDWANGGRLDLILDARASQASVDDLPTNAELTTALGTADDAILAVLGTPAGVSMSADIAAIKAETASILTDTAEIGAAGAGLTAVPWNASWDAEVQSEVTDALNAYDPPTKAELDAAVANVSVDEIQATALADLFNTDSGTTYGSAVAGSVVKEIADNAGGSSLSEAGIASAVRTELTTELGRIDVATSTRASQASVDTVDTVADAIKAKTDQLTFTVAGQVDANAESMNATTINGTGVSGDLWRGA